MSIRRDPIKSCTDSGLEAVAAAAADAAMAVVVAMAVAVAVLALEDAEGLEAAAVAAAGGEAAAEVAVCRGEVATTARRSPRHLRLCRARSGVHVWLPAPLSRPRPARSLRKSRNLILFWSPSPFHTSSGSEPSTKPGPPFRRKFFRGQQFHWNCRQAVHMTMPERWNTAWP
jgi:hypothetical protein